MSISFLCAPFASVVEELVSWRRDLGQAIDLSHVALDELPSAIEPFEAPWTKELLFDCGEWTAYLNNNIDGGDPTAAAPNLSVVLGVDLLVATHLPRTSAGHASTQLWLLGPAGEPPLMYRRTITADCVDGRWSWETSGDPLPFEIPGSLPEDP